MTTNTTTLEDLVTAACVEQAARERAQPGCTPMTINPQQEADKAALRQRLVTHLGQEVVGAFFGMTDIDYRTQRPFLWFAYDHVFLNIEYAEDYVGAVLRVLPHAVREYSEQHGTYPPDTPIRTIALQRPVRDIRHDVLCAIAQVAQAEHLLITESEVAAVRQMQDREQFVDQAWSLLLPRLLCILDIAIESVSDGVVVFTINQLTLPILKWADVQLSALWETDLLPLQLTATEIGMAERLTDALPLETRTGAELVSVLTTLLREEAADATT